MNDQRLALFLMLGQTASRTMQQVPGVAQAEPLRISETYDLSASMPDEVRLANDAAAAYKLFFIFERYLREFVIEALSADSQEDWWPKVPKDVQDEVAKLEETEEAKSWMALGSRDRFSLLTYPQLIRVIEHCWKDNFEDLIRDRTLLQEARLIAHSRNTICHMSNIPEEEVNRVKQVMRDWFRRVAP